MMKGEKRSSIKEKGVREVRNPGKNGQLQRPLLSGSVVCLPRFLALLEHACLGENQQMR